MLTPRNQGPEIFSNADSLPRRRSGSTGQRGGEIRDSEEQGGDGGGGKGPGRDLRESAGGAGEWQWL